jgi:hypothetical protein
VLLVVAAVGVDEYRLLGDRRRKRGHRFPSAADGSVTLDLIVEDSRARDSATVEGKTDFPITSLAGKISVASGKAALAKDVKAVSKEGEGETLIVVGARIAESEAKSK